MTARYRAVLLTVPLTVLATGLAGCGVPTGGAPTTIAPTDVPYGLASPSPTATPPETSQPAEAPFRTYWVAEDQSLVPVPREITGSTRAERLDELLEDLAGGPTVEERNEQLSTALPPDVRLTASAVTGSTVTIDIDIAGLAEAPSGPARGRAVGQVVLTATSVPGIEAALLTVDGSPVDAPLPSGELTSRPLTAADYRPLLIPPEGSPSGVPPFPADTAIDTESGSPGARLTVSDIRIGQHDRFERVVFEVAGSGTPGWDVGYVVTPTSGDAGALVPVRGDAVLEVRLTGVGPPPSPEAEAYAGPERVSVRDTSVITEVVFDGATDDVTTAFVGTAARVPFRVYLLANPTRVVLEVSSAS